MPRHKRHSYNRSHHAKRRQRDGDYYENNDCCNSSCSSESTEAIIIDDLPPDQRGGLGLGGPHVPLPGSAWSITSPLPSSFPSGAGACQTYCPHGGCSQLPVPAAAPGIDTTRSQQYYYPGPGQNPATMAHASTLSGPTAVASTSADNNNNTSFAGGVTDNTQLQFSQYANMDTGPAMLNSSTPAMSGGTATGGGYYSSINDMQGSMQQQQQGYAQSYRHHMSMDQDQEQYFYDDPWRKKESRGQGKQSKSTHDNRDKTHHHHHQNHHQSHHHRQHTGKGKEKERGKEKGKGKSDLNKLVSRDKQSEYFDLNGGGSGDGNGMITKNEQRVSKWLLESEVAATVPDTLME